MLFFKSVRVAGWVCKDCTTLANLFQLWGLRIQKNEQNDELDTSMLQAVAHFEKPSIINKAIQNSTIKWRVYTKQQDRQR